MKLPLVFIALFLQSFTAYSQREYARLSAWGNLDIWKPYSKVVGEYQDSTGNIFSNTYGINLQSNIIVKEKWSLSAGVSFKRINYKVVDKLHVYRYNYKVFNSGSWYYYEVTDIYDDPADLITRSDNFGLNIEFAYNIRTQSNFNMSVGIQPEVYFLEYYNSYYSSPDIASSIYTENSVPQPAPGPDEALFLSSVNSNLFYRFTWYPSDFLSLGANVYIGMNLYSDWVEFKRYGYLGLGLELGFGKFRAHEKE